MLLEHVGLIERTRISSFANGKGSCGLYALAWRAIVPSEKYDSPSVATKSPDHRYASWQRPGDWKAIVTRYKRRAQGKTNADHQEWLKQVGGLSIEAVQKAA